MPALTEVLPDIFAWHWFAERFGYDFNGHLVRHPGGNLAIDPVEMDGEALEALAAEGVARIVLTNRNHFRAAEKLRARTGARVAVHPADAAFVAERGVTVADDLAIGQMIGPFQVLDASGKSPGEVALHWPERKILVVGDACVGKQPGVLGLLPERVMDDPARLRRSLVRLAEIDFDVLLLGDGHNLLKEGRSALAALVASFD